MQRTWTTAFARLALAAMLALAMLPALGRIAQVHRVGVDAMHGRDDRCADARHAPSHGHRSASDDCDYCPLLAGLSSVSMSAGSVPALQWTRSLATGAETARPIRAASAGLGARGPPAIG